MRYFLTTNAARPVVAGGFSLEFEPVSLRGGSWLGVLAVEESTATAILSASPPNVDEIDLTRYEVLKKKLTASNPSSPQRVNGPPPSPKVAVADRAGSPIGHTASKVQDHNSTAGITAITLMMTSNQPPPEPLLAGGGKQKKPWK